MNSIRIKQTLWGLFLVSALAVLYSCSSLVPASAADRSHLPASAADIDSTLASMDLETAASMLDRKGDLQVSFGDSTYTIQDVIHARELRNYLSFLRATREVTSVATQFVNSEVPYEQFTHIKDLFAQYSRMAFSFQTGSNVSHALEATYAEQAKLAGVAYRQAESKYLAHNEEVAKQVQQEREESRLAAQAAKAQQEIAQEAEALESQKKRSAEEIAKQQELDVQATANMKLHVSIEQPTPAATSSSEQKARDEPMDFSRNQIIQILEQNVFDFFAHETNGYDTELKKSVFKRTDEYKKYSAQLLDLKRQVVSNKMKIPLADTHELSDYSMKTGAFSLSLGANFGMGTFEASYKYSLDGFIDENIPVNQTTAKSLGDGSLVLYSVLLKCDEETALKIENMKSSLRMMIEFSVVGVTTKKYPFISLAPQRTEYVITEKLVSVKNTRVIIADSEGNELVSTRYK